MSGEEIINLMREVAIQTQTELDEDFVQRFANLMEEKIDKRIDIRMKLYREALKIAAYDVLKLKGYYDWDIPILALDIYIPDVLKEAEAKMEGRGENK